MTEDLNTLREALEPCPFCGGKAKLYGSNTLFGFAIAGWFVECDACGVSGKRSEETDSGASVIAAWNRRAPRLEAAADHVPDAGKMVPELSREDVARLMTECVAEGSFHDPQNGWHMGLDLVRFASLVRSVPVGEVKPVAWIYWHPRDDTFNGSDTIHKKAVSRFTDDTRLAMQRDGWKFEPLYTTPPAPIEGWRWVPVEPTPEMIAAWPNFRHGSGHQDQIYRAMLAAAPQPGDRHG